MGKTVKKLFKITGITLLVLIAAAILIPVFFKKQITALVKSEINKNLVASVEFGEVSLSFFRHFPKLSISIEDLSVVGQQEFAADTLLSTKRLDASVNLISLIKGSNIKVSGVYLETPRIHALVHSNGKANWDIAMADSTIVTDTSNTASAFRMTLKKYEINDGYLLYRDETADIFAEIEGLDHTGSGDLTEDVFTLATSTSINSGAFSYASIPYLVNTKTLINSDIKIDNSTSTYTFRTDDIQLNNLKLNADGFFQLANDSTYRMDIKFRTPSNDFKDILSLVPGIYKQDFDKIKTSGQAALEGFVKGTYSSTELPAYDVKLDVKDGSFQYPDLPGPVKNIQVALRAQNVDGKMDNTIIDVSKAHLEMDNEPFDLRFLFRNPETVQYIDAQAKGKLNLANVSKFIKLEDGIKLSGRINADAFAKGNLSDIQARQGQFNAGGFFDIANLFFSSNSIPQPIKNGNLRIEINNHGGIADNTTIDIKTGHVEVGTDPVDFTFTLRKPLSTADFTGTAKGIFNLGNIRQFVTLEKGTSIDGLLNADLSFKGNKTAIDNGEYEKIVINGNAGVANLEYVSTDYPTGIKLKKATATFHDRTVELNELNGSYLKTNFSSTGEFTNLVGYAMNDQPLSGKLNVNADQLNLADWMGTEPTTTQPASPEKNENTDTGPFVVPGGIDIAVNANAGRVTYDNVDYTHLAGTLILKDETVHLQNVKANAHDGSIRMDGSYSTKQSKTEPRVNLSYDVKDMDVQKIFLSYNTVQSLMPIGKFLSGKLSSQLSLVGKLNEEMMPELSSLTGKGNLHLLEGVLQKFGPLEKLASTLQIDRLKSITIKDIKNYFEFANGTVLVKPFTIKVEDMELQIGGKHGLDQTMDYIIAMKVPRKYLGTQGNNLVNGLVTKANSKGIPVKVGEMVDLNVKMVGSLTNPNIQVDLKQVAGDAIQELQQQAVDFAKAKADSATKRIKDSLNAVKNQVVNDLKNDLKDKIFGKDTAGVSGDSAKKPRPVDKLKQTLGDVFNKKKKPADSTRR